MKQKCKTCQQEIHLNCDWNQGRCPHTPPLIELSTARKLLLLLAAPFIIGAWTVMNPKKVWQQALKDWNIE
jgi:hypothetical protein